MRPHKTRGLTAVLAICASLWPACGDKAKEVSGRTARAAVACRKACGLGLQISKELPSSTCKDDCIARVVGSPERCTIPRIEWLECLVTQGRSGAQNADRDGRARQSCAKEEGILEGCEAECRLGGTLRSGVLQGSEAPPRAVTGSFELTHCGCEPCRPVAGAPPGAPCDSPKVCGERVLECNLQDSSIKVRLCLGGRCGDDAEVRTAAARIEELRGCRREPR